MKKEKKRKEDRAGSGEKNLVGWWLGGWRSCCMLLHLPEKGTHCLPERQAGRAFSGIMEIKSMGRQTFFLSMPVTYMPYLPAWCV